MLGISSVLNRDLRVWVVLSVEHTFIDTHISSWSYRHQKPYSKPCFKQLLCPNSSQCSRRQWKLFLLHFYLIYTGLCIIRNLLLCTCRFLIILGIANLAWTSRHYFCLLIHCFGSTVIYRPKPATVKDATSFTVFSTSDRRSISEIRKMLFIFYFLPSRCVPPERHSNFSFPCASHQFWGRKGTLKIPLSGRKSVAHLCISNNRLLKITNLNYIVFLTLWSVFLKTVFEHLCTRDISGLVSGSMKMDLTS